MKPISFLLILANAALFAVHLPAAEWKAGVARIKITPDKPLVMSGYASRIKPYESIEHDLWAKALVLEDVAGNRAAILTMDLAGIYSDITPAIYAGIEKSTGIKKDAVLLTWSHTHSGPRLSLKSAPYPGVPATDIRNTVEYTRQLQQQLVELTATAARQLQPVSLGRTTGVATFVMNRRERTSRGIRLGVNPSGHIDRNVPVMKVTSADGRLIAVLFQAACHNTTLGPRNDKLAGDYAGFAQIHIEENHPGTLAMFMAGCGGNANPYPRDSMELARRHGTELGTEVRRLLNEKPAPVNGPLKTVRGDAHLTLQPPGKPEELEKLAQSGPNYLRGNARTMLDALKKGEPLPSHFSAPVSVWQFGDSLTLIGISGEVVSGYVLAMQNSIGHLNLWVTAYCHDYFGYLPDAQIVRDGGYETRGLSSGLGWFAEEAEADMVRTITELARKAGRKLP